MDASILDSGNICNGLLRGLKDLIAILKQELPFFAVYERNGAIECWSPRNREGQWIEFSKFIEDTLREHGLEFDHAYDSYDSDRGTTLRIFFK